MFRFVKRLAASGVAAQADVLARSGAWNLSKVRVEPS